VARQEETKRREDNRKNKTDLNPQSKVHDERQCLTEPKEEMAFFRLSRSVASNEGGSWTDGSVGGTSLFRDSFLV